MNIVVVGHVDHGKSTLIGRLLYDSEQLPEGKINEVQKLVDLYRRRFEFAYFLDAFGDEVEQERTIDTTRIRFKSPRRVYTIIDVPGHKEFIKNMLTGASRADAAVLVVDASKGIEEQTRRHTFLLDLLGIKNLIVLVNKMDLVEYSMKEYDRTVEEVVELLQEYKFNLEVVPGSAFMGDNIYKPSERMVHFSSSTLVDLLDRLEETSKDTPLRIIVQDAYGGKLGVRIVSGTLRRLDQLTFQPSGLTCIVGSIEVYTDLLEEAETGRCVLLNLLSPSLPPRGDVGGLSSDTLKIGKCFNVEVTLIDGKVKQGDKLSLKCGTKTVRCRMGAFLYKIDTETGVHSNCLPLLFKELKAGEAGAGSLDTEPIVIEKFSEIPELGRFVLTKNNRSIGLGVVLDV